MKELVNKTTILAVVTVLVLLPSLLCRAQQTAAIPDSSDKVARPDARSLLLGAAAALERHKSVEYAATMKVKTYASDDTLTLNGTGKLYREKKDSIWGGKFQINTTGDTLTHDNLYWIYDGKAFYEINENTDTITSYNSQATEGVGRDGNQHLRLLWDNFMHPNNLTTQAGYQMNIIGMQDVEGVPCYQLVIVYPGEGAGTMHKSETSWLFISQKDSMPILQQWLCKFQGEYQFNELRIHRCTFDKLKDVAFNAPLRKNYTVIEYKSDTEGRTLLDSGAVAPTVTGTVFQLMTDVTLNFKGKITLLHFWRQDCPTCIQAIPSVEKLYEKYKKAAFQVIGVNSLDSTEEQIQRLARFCDYNKMKYYTILTVKELSDSYRVNEDAFYIIDKNGNVAYAQAGSSNDLFETLDKRISELLK